MRIYVTGAGTFTGDHLEAGKWYEAQDAVTGTEAQNKAFHALVSEYYSSGAYSYNAKNVEELKGYIKKTYGAGFDCYYAVGDKGGVYGLKRYKTKTEAFEAAVVNQNGEKLIHGHLKSWAKYTLKERTAAIDGLISEMLQAGVNSRKFEEILNGMDGVRHG
jgi:hypothetical protein